jgi:arylformamidase
MNSKIFDITPKISSRLGVFPGDRSFERSVAMSFKKGDHLELSSIHTTLHLGAHADAPSHYSPNGATIEKRNLGPYMGRAQVIRIPGLVSGARIFRKDLTCEVRAPRILFDTGSFQNPEKWNSKFNSLSPELIEYLADQAVCLVGLDTPSVDPEEAKDLISHQALFRRDMSVLEGLYLKDVPEGFYTLIALPLPIEGGDASPVRAVLLPEVQGFPEFT